MTRPARPLYDKTTRTFGEGPPAEGYQEKSEKDQERGYAGLDANGRVLASVLGTGTADDTTVLDGAQAFVPKSTLGPTFAIDGTPLPREPVIDLRGAVVAEDISGTTRYTVARENPLMDPRGLALGDLNLYEAWTFNADTIGATTQAGFRGVHSLTFPEPPTECGLPWESADGFRWLNAVAVISDPEVLRAFVQSSDFTLLIWAQVMSGFSADQIMMSLGAFGDSNSNQNLSIYPYIEADLTLHDKWEHATGSDVDTAHGRVTPGTSLFAFGRQYTDDGKATSVAWFSGRRIGTGAGLTKPDGGSAGAGRILGKENGDLTDGVRIFQVAIVRGLMSDADVLEQYLRGVPTNIIDISGGSGVEDHGDLTGREWISEGGHTGSGSAIAGFDGSGDPVEYPIPAAQAIGGTGSTNPIHGQDLSGPLLAAVVKQASTSFNLTGILSPPQITGNLGDYDPTGLADASILMLDGDGDYRIGGLTTGSAGRILLVANNSVVTIELANNDSGASAGNRFMLQGPVSLPPGSAVLLVYEPVGACWLLASMPVNTDVTPGDYTNADITVDQQGRITAAANGSGGSTDADTLDGLDSAQFVRTDASSTIVASTLILDGDSVLEVHGFTDFTAGGEIAFYPGGGIFSGAGAGSGLDADKLDGANLSTDGTLAANSNELIPSQKAVKTYVDTLAAGLKWKAPVRAATTAAGTLATSFENGDTIDGVVLATGDRILIKNQASGSENGIYVVAASGAPSRSTDADTGTELVSAAVFVQEGTANADRAFVCTNDSITIGATSIVFTGFASVVGALLASNNLSDVASAGTARTNLGLAIGTNVQAYDADLDALAALASNGVIARTGAGTVSARTITGTAPIGVTNGDGVSGNPTITLTAGTGVIGYAKWQPDAPPVSPSAYDDEFSVPSTLDAKWSVFDPGSVISHAVDAYGNWAQSVAHTTNYRVCGIYQAFPGVGTYIIKVGEYYKTAVTTWHGPGFIIGQDFAGAPTTSDIVTIGLVHTTTTDTGVYKYNYTAYDATAASAVGQDINATIGTAFYIRIRFLTSTSIEVDVSFGGQWMQCLTYTLPFTPGHIGIGQNTRNSAAGNWDPRMARYDFFRYYAGADAEKLNPISGRLVS